MSAADYRAWFANAQSDLLSIKNNMSAERVPWDVVTYRAQQAAEKYRSIGLVIWNGLDRPFTLTPRNRLR